MGAETSSGMFDSVFKTARSMTPEFIKVPLRWARDAYTGITTNTRVATNNLKTDYSVRGYTSTSSANLDPAEERALKQSKELKEAYRISKELGDACKSKHEATNALNKATFAFKNKYGRFHISLYVLQNGYPTDEFDDNMLRSVVGNLKSSNKNLDENEAMKDLKKDAMQVIELSKKADQTVALYNKLSKDSSKSSEGSEKTENAIDSSTRAKREKYSNNFLGKNSQSIAELGFSGDMLTWIQTPTTYDNIVAFQKVVYGKESGSEIDGAFGQDTLAKAQEYKSKQASKASNEAGRGNGKDPSQQLATSSPPAIKSGVNGSTPEPYKSRLNFFESAFMSNFTLPPGITITKASARIDTGKVGLELPDRMKDGVPHDITGTLSDGTVILGLHAKFVNGKVQFYTEGISTLVEASDRKGYQATKPVPLGGNAYEITLKDTSKYSIAVSDASIKMEKKG